MALEGKKAFVLVTGGSRGIGKAIALELAKTVAPQSVYLLLARSASALDETRDSITSLTGENNSTCLPVDLSKPENCDFGAEIAKALEDHGKTVNDFELAIIVHNAASIGDISRRAVEIDSVDAGVEYYKLNLLSAMLLNTAFFRTFPRSDGLKRSLVNISSLCGIQPFKSFAFYCSGKAAREMFFKVLAIEEPDISVINYGPGPVDTEMTSDIIKNSWDTDLSEANQRMRDEGAILTVEQTCSKLIKILNEEKYKSGDHVDYFDSI